jgi:thiamine pyrophosphate-dependent acetolactate synthase large subunit-like protein
MAAAATQQPAPDFGDDPNTADIIVETLLQWGVTHVFGVVGDGINSPIEALRKRQDKIAFIPARHEEAAAFMACEDIRPAIRAALASPKAALVEAVVDPEEKPTKPDELKV